MVSQSPELGYPLVSGDALDQEQTPDASRIAHFSRIAIGEGGETELQSRFDTLIHAFEVVQSVDVPSAKDLLKPHCKDDLRPDKSDDSLGSSKALGNAPQSHEGHFRVPPVLS